MTDVLKVAAIVPAHNEERTVGGVVRVLRESGRFDEIVVMSDGSTDGTARAAREAGATLVHETPERRGKGRVMGHAVGLTGAPIICFFDADLIGLASSHVSALIEPVLSGRRAMNVGLRDRGRSLTWLASKLPLIGGERVMRREIITAVSDRFLRGFKVETALNYYCRVNGLPYGAVVLPGLGIVRKMQKVGFFRGLIGYIRMWAQVAWAMIEVRLAHRQFEQMGGHMGHRHR